MEISEHVELKSPCRQHSLSSLSSVRIPQINDSFVERTAAFFPALLFVFSLEKKWAALLHKTPCAGKVLSPNILYRVVNIDSSLGFRSRTVMRCRKVKIRDAIGAWKLESVLGWHYDVEYTRKMTPILKYYTHYSRRPGVRDFFEVEILL